MNYSFKNRQAMIVLLCTLLLFPLILFSQATKSSIKLGGKWLDNESVHINAHGGGMLYHNNIYYWFGEHKGATGDALVGISCYSSNDLYNWKNEGVALSVSTEKGSDIESGCKMERPKVIYNEKTGKFVMYFHLELKGQGYDAARVGIAVSDQVTGPFIYLNSLRPNAGEWPIGCSSEEEAQRLLFNQYLIREHDGGQTSRDMTLFVDDDGKAYHIYSGEGNGTLHISLLSDDYLSHTGIYARVGPGGYNEAPTIFKRGSRYYMITSGTSGWAPNAARQLTATNMMGPWTEFSNPCIGNDADKTFQSQGTYILPIAGKKNAYVFMADRWNRNDLKNSLYIWLPIQFKNGLPVLQWMGEWAVTFFTDTFEKLQGDIASGKDFLTKLKIGNNIGEYTQETYDTFDVAIQNAEKIMETATEAEITEAIIILGDAAAALQVSKVSREINALEDGDYYVKVKNKYYLTNFTAIERDKSLLLQETKITETDAQVFSILKHPLTGRYKMVSKLDQRNVNEGCRIRNDWGPNDHLWRTMNFYYNGSDYAIQTDGKAFGLMWRLDEASLSVKGESPFRLAVEHDNDFIFTLEKATGTTILNDVENVESKIIISIRSNIICIETRSLVNISIYTASGVMIKDSKINSDMDFPVETGIYIVHVQSESDFRTQKVIIR